MRTIFLFLLLSVFSTLNAENYSLRKYSHVRSFYSDLSQDTINLCLKYNVPPAAILAIAGYESGYGTGYVSEISGNILSLNATSSEPELPALYLARNSKTNKILFDKRDIRKQQNIIWEQRPKSLKKDYRPAGIAGTRSNLTYFRNNAKARKKANLRCVRDFLTKRLSLNSSISAYRNTKQYLNSMVNQHGKSILFDYNLNISFLNKVGGRRGSYNSNPKWPGKVISLMERAGLIKLTKELEDNKSFNVAWGGLIPQQNRYVYSDNKEEENYIYSPIKKVINDSKYDKIIADIANKNALSTELLKALIWKKSSFNPNLEKNGGIGLMQITMTAAKHWAKANGYTMQKSYLKNPSLNITIGAWYLTKSKQYWSEFGNHSDTLALLEYNLGRENMKKYIKIYSKSDIRIESPEIQRYMKQIINRYSLYLAQG